MRNLGMVVVAVVSASGLLGCGADPAEDEGAPLVEASAIQTATLAGNTTLKFLPPGASFGAASATEATATASRTVSLFYPKPGQSSDGLCWQGLTSDSTGHIYPVASGQIVKLDKNANIINGKDDTNFFATG